MVDYTKMKAGGAVPGVAGALADGVKPPVPGVAGALIDRLKTAKPQVIKGP